MYTLQHYGVKGMRWGIRRHRESSLTPSKKRKSMKISDELMYGEKGAKRIQDRMKSGMSRNKAVRREIGRQISVGIAYSAALMGVSYLITSGKGRQLVETGKSAVKNVMNSKYNTFVLDKNGNQIAKYKDLFATGADAVNKLMRR